MDNALLDFANAALLRREASRGQAAAAAAAAPAPAPAPDLQRSSTSEAAAILAGAGPRGRRRPREAAAEAAVEAAAAAEAAVAPEVDRPNWRDPAVRERFYRDYTNLAIPVPKLLDDYKISRNAYAKRIKERPASVPARPKFTPELYRQQAEYKETRAAAATYVPVDHSKPWTDEETAHLLATRSQYKALRDANQLPRPAHGEPIAMHTWYARQYPERFPGLDRDKAARRVQNRLYKLTSVDFGNAATEAEFLQALRKDADKAGGKWSAEVRAAVRADYAKLTADGTRYEYMLEEIAHKYGKNVFGIHEHTKDIRRDPDLRRATLEAFNARRLASASAPAPSAAAAADE